MKTLLLGLTLAAMFTALTSAQVGAPNPQGSNTLAQTVEHSVDGTVRLRGVRRSRPRSGQSPKPTPRARAVSSRS